MTSSCRCLFWLLFLSIALSSHAMALHVESDDESTAGGRPTRSGSDLREDDGTPEDEDHLYFPNEHTPDNGGDGRDLMPSMSEMDYEYDANALQFRMDVLDDVLELQHLVEFADPDRGVCPTFHSADLFFGFEDVEAEYSVDQLTILQEEFLPVLPMLKQEWKEHGQEALQRLLGGESVITFSSASSDDTFQPESFNVISAEDHQQYQRTSSSRIVINGIEIDLSSVLSSAGFSVDLSDVSISIESPVGDGGENGGVKQEPIVIDLNKAIRDRERAKYMNQAQGDMEDTHSRCISSRVAKQGGISEVDEEQRRAVEEYNHQNEHWMKEQQSLLDGKRTREKMPKMHAVETHQSSNQRRLTNIVNAIRSSCESSSASCASELHEISLSVRRQISSSLILPSSPWIETIHTELDALENTYLHSHAEAQQDIKEDAVKQEEEQHRRLWCTNLTAMWKRAAPSYTAHKFTSLSDVLLPMLAHSATPSSPPPSDEAGEVNHVLAVLHMVEHGDEKFMFCLKNSGVLSLDPALLPEIFYAAGVTRMSMTSANESNETETASDAHAYLNVLQSSSMGSVNAMMALASMHEHGFVAQKSCPLAAQILADVAPRTHRYFFERMTELYRAPSTTSAFDKGALRDATRFRRQLQSMFTIDHEDFRTTSHEHVRENFVGIKERFLTSRSTHATRVLLHMIGLFFSGVATSTNGEAELEDLHCWTWLIIARLYPPAAIRNRARVESKCHSSSVWTYFINEIGSANGAADDGGEHNTPRRVVASTRTWIRQSIDDIAFFLTSVHALSSVAMQELIIPVPAVDRDPGAAADPSANQSLRVARMLLNDIQFLVAELFQDARVSAVRFFGGATGGDILSIGDEWHRALYITAVFSHRQRDGPDDDDSTPRSFQPDSDNDLTHRVTETYLNEVSAGFMPSEVLWALGLVEHLSGNPLEALRLFFQGASVELDSDQPHMILSEMTYPLEGAKINARGDCMFYAALVLESQPEMFYRLKNHRGTATTSMDLPDGVSKSLHSFASVEEFVSDMFHVCGKAPISHSGCIAETLRLRYARQFGDLVGRYPFTDVEEGEVNLEHRDGQCAVLLADLRFTVQSIHEHRDLQAVEWMTDWYAESVQPLSVLARLQKTVSTWMCHTLSFTESPSAACESPWWKHSTSSVGRHGNITSEVHAVLHSEEASRKNSSFYVADALVSAQLLHTFLQEGSPEAAAVLMLLPNGVKGDLVFREEEEEPYYRFPLMQAASQRVTKLFQWSCWDVLQEEFLASQRPTLHDGDDHDAENVEPQRAPTLSSQTPFLFKSSESRLEVAHATLLSLGLQSWRHVCFLVVEAASGSASTSPIHFEMCRRPGEASSLAATLRVTDSPLRQAFLVAMEKEAVHNGTETEIGRLIRVAARSFAWCSGQRIAQLWGFHDDVNVNDEGRGVFLTNDGKRISLADEDSTFPVGNTECILSLISMAEDFGAGALINVPLPFTSEEMFYQELLAASVALSERLLEFHGYSKPLSTSSEDTPPDDPLTAEAPPPEEDDPDDVHLQQRSLQQQLRNRNDKKNRRISQRKQKVSLKQASLLNYLDARGDGEGRWIMQRRLSVPGALQMTKWLQWASWLLKRS